MTSHEIVRISQTVLYLTHQHFTNWSVKKSIFKISIWNFYSQFLMLIVTIVRNLKHLKHYRFQYHLDRLDKRGLSWINSITMSETRQSFGGPHQLCLFIHVFCSSYSPWEATRILLVDFYRSFRSLSFVREKIKTYFLIPVPLFWFSNFEWTLKNLHSNCKWLASFCNIWKMILFLMIWWRYQLITNLVRTTLITRNVERWIHERKCFK